MKNLKDLDKKFENVELNIPKGYDAEIIHDWIPKDDIIIAQFENDDNYCVMTKSKDDEKIETEFRFTRFFHLGIRKTQASVDFSGGIEKLVKEFGSLMNHLFI